MYYYAYGSNLSTSYIRRTCPSAAIVMNAQLPKKNPRHIFVKMLARV